MDVCFNYVYVVDVIVVCVCGQFYCGVVVSNVYMLKSVGDSTPPCGTLFLNWCSIYVLFLNVVYALRALM